MVEEALFWDQKGPALYSVSVTSFVLHGQKLLWATSSSLQSEPVSNGFARLIVRIEVNVAILDSSWCVFMPVTCQALCEAFFIRHLV